MEIRGLSEAIVRSLDNVISDVAHVADLSMAPQSEKNMGAPHLLAKGRDWKTATERYELIKPLLEMHNRQASDVEAVASKAKKSVTTIYRWIARFEEQGLVSSMLRSERSDKGDNRIGQEVEEIIQLKIDEIYLGTDRPSVTELYEEIERECRSLGLSAPHKNTVYARVKKIAKEKLLTKRYNAKYARQKTKPVPGVFPGADFPNAVVQIDHTPVDVIVVDRVHRLPIGRPYLTLALEVCTKMVSGFCMTLDPPSASTAGLCISHAVNKKHLWLAKRDIDAEWPIYGKMQKIHMDNAKEFRGDMLKRACDQHDIIIEHRPKGMPNYGPHVERAFRTFMSKMHSLPGTTFSNVKEKLEYDSEGHACMTLQELELWFTLFLVYYYHHKGHKGISDIPPIKLYAQLVHGTTEQPGVGLPAPIEDEEKFKLDFTPYVRRTVQREGILIDHISYYAPALNKWIDSKDPKTKKARKFVCVRDPRDISIIYFLDPDTKTYTPIPYADNTRPPISLWELKAVMKRIAEDPLNVVNEEMIFQGIEKMRNVERQAVEKTRLAKQQRASEKRKRRMAERRENWKDVHATPASGTPADIAYDAVGDEPVAPKKSKRFPNIEVVLPDE
jgi:putative transposase